MDADFKKPKFPVSIPRQLLILGNEEVRILDNTETDT